MRTKSESLPHFLLPKRAESAVPGPPGPSVLEVRRGGRPMAEPCTQKPVVVAFGRTIRLYCSAGGNPGEDWVPLERRNLEREVERGVPGAAATS